MYNVLRGEMAVSYFEQSGDICRLFSWMKLNKKENCRASSMKNEP